MEAYQQRVIEERDELAGKLDRLHAFIRTSPQFRLVGGLERDRLCRQSDAMRAYLRVLNERIEAF